MTVRYRVVEPAEPRDLPLELVQEWDADIGPSVGSELRKGTRGVWVVAAIEPDPDREYAGRKFFVRR